MKAGTYYVGDPCYVIADDKWNDFLEPYWEGEGSFEFEGVPVWAHRTAYGDGIFPDNLGNHFFVDAGMIGVIPLELCKKRNKKEMMRLGKIIEFKKDFNVAYNDGTFYIGHVVIATGDEFPTDEEEDE